ncbi:MAG: hypothetical protein ACT4PZ_04455 [Panacagrimonas sp.]
MIRLRDQTDALAARYPVMSFISFGDSLLIKSNWAAGHYERGIRNNYDPESFIRVFGELQPIYRETLGLDIYGVITQGSNAYYEDDLLHISEQRNHICLNSLGLPFAQIQAIDYAARQAIREKAHEPTDLYMDELFFRSLQFKFEFDKKTAPRQPYSFGKFKTDSTYFHADYVTIRDNLKGPDDLSPVIG